MSFGIKSGVTIPIKCGFGRTAAFTLATDEGLASSSRLAADAREFLQMVGLYFHAHVTTKLQETTARPLDQGILTQRERQCLAWVAQGKTAADIALLVGISARTVMFHLENARRKLSACSMAQCVAEARRFAKVPTQSSRTSAQA
jgi:LuxR family transcriptional regulator, activator of conjugal transfer of Ti plasmids